jgi:hypothetical protein
MLAAALLTIVSFPALFLGTVAGFIASALLVVAARLPARAKADPGRFRTDVTKGVRIYTRTPRLCGLMVKEAAVAPAGAMVYVNTVVLFRPALVWAKKLWRWLRRLRRRVDAGGLPSAAHP